MWEHPAAEQQSRGGQSCHPPGTGEGTGGSASSGGVGGLLLCPAQEGFAPLSASFLEPCRLHGGSCAFCLFPNSARQTRGVPTAPRGLAPDSGVGRDGAARLGREPRDLEAGHPPSRMRQGTPRSATSVLAVSAWPARPAGLRVARVPGHPRTCAAGCLAPGSPSPAWESRSLGVQIPSAGTSRRNAPFPVLLCRCFSGVSVRSLRGQDAGERPRTPGTLPGAGSARVAGIAASEPTAASLHPGRSPDRGMATRARARPRGLQRRGGSHSAMGSSSASPSFFPTSTTEQPTQTSVTLFL